MSIKSILTKKYYIKDLLLKVNKKSIFIIILLSLFSLSYVSYAWFLWSYLNNDAWEESNDQWKLEWSYIPVFDFMDEYSEGKRGYIKSASINSRLFWDFPAVWWTIYLIESYITWCEDKCFSFSWSFTSDFYWDLTINEDSLFYDNQDINLEIFSELLWYKVVSKADWSLDSLDRISGTIDDLLSNLDDRINDQTWELEISEENIDSLKSISDKIKESKAASERINEIYSLILDTHDLDEANLLLDEAMSLAEINLKLAKEARDAALAIINDPNSTDDEIYTARLALQAALEAIALAEIALDNLEAAKSKINQRTYNVSDQKEIWISWVWSFMWNSSNVNNLSNWKSWNLSSSDLKLGESSKAILKSRISKNIIKVTKSLKPLNNINLNEDYSLNQIKNTSSTLENTYYYDFSWKEKSNDNWYWNKWHILSIENSNYNTPIWDTYDYYEDNYKLPVEWKNNIVVKWWNIYINSDIYTWNDSKDILIIVATRDDINNKNGWNIYIDPKVTNIDAILIAEWSILSYRKGSWVLKINENIELLWKQLLIYWSVLSNNVINTTTIPYWTDEYINKKYFYSNSEDNIYDFINLRSFRIVYSDLEKSNANCWWEYLRVPFITYNNDIKYSWAGKWECFNKNINNLEYEKWNKVSWLRHTTKANSLVIEYNTNINFLSPRLLQN